ncbi:hypothetical protein SAMN05428975_1011 [Mucilaginibacter sp. OK268]|uniref:glycan-binding surface protein n=1 Tax=Mucilaginibacter sp. OK268 TaxID=1881048 RepID=UPI00088FBC49|nr:glycan-binding surface protein [Mucilaginibacter sp. OK268]SDP28957.1 hypothetical protein SAMN05428975_1011 [Mucilaginibacter sp. OK268]
MKKKSYLSLCVLPLFFAIVALLPACKKNNDSGGAAAPVVTSVRLYVPSPNDIVLSNGDPKSSASIYGNGGIYVAIVGHNLQNATEIDFNGVPAKFNVALFAPNNAVVQVPTINYAKIDTTKLYTLVYKTAGGSTTFSFKLGPMLPTLTGISDVFTQPGDSVYVTGTDLVLIKSVSYGGSVISSFKTDTNGRFIGFLMPAVKTTDQVLVTTKSGSAAFKIVATPTITGISNENALSGDSVYVYGTNLRSIQKVVFAGTTITSYKALSNGKAIGFVLPALSSSGPVSVTTEFGTATTVYNVNDVATGSISNWDSNFNWQYWGAGKQTNGDPNFSGNSSTYFVLDISGLAKGDGWPWSTNIPMNGAQWVPKANIADSASHWAFKFEVSIPKAWNGTTVDIVSGVGGYIARWEPWQKNATTTAPYITKGWVTVTIPLTSFRASDPTLGEGMGASISKISDLTGTSGNTSCTLYIHNYGTSAAGFYGAVDNLRVVKIK